MATITPVRSSIGVNIEKVFWETLTSADTATSVLLSGYSGAVCSLQATGTFGGATITLQGSNDGTNFSNLSDTGGTPISLTAAGVLNFAVGCAYVRPASTGGSGDDVDVTLVVRN